MSEQAEAKGGIWKVIGASSAGTLIEWYDFYIFGSLATTIASHFFPKDNPTAGLLSTLATFATGFIVRPFGALIFGRLGDLAGRKVAFLMTLMLMGLSTFAIGIIPDYSQIGIAAPILLLLLRLLQGLALGGEYGGAATYVAEHSPDGRRGFYTSFIQTTATLGLFISLGVILATRTHYGQEAFDAWAWRVPFLLSALLIVFSYFIRIKLAESPLFVRAKAAGKTSTNPLRDSFVNPANRRLVLLALFGATAGQGVVWYTGQFYALYFLEKVLNVEMVGANTIIAIALVFATPFFVVFGALSDRIGRKPIIMAGCLLAVLAWFPIYQGMTAVVNPATATPISAPVVETSLKETEGKSSQVTKMVTRYPDFTVTETKSQPLPEGKEEVKKVLVPEQKAKNILTLLVFLQVLFVTMVYGPIAAFLVELFPTKIRYTSMSLPYHIGNGVFGGLVPLIGLSMVSATGNIYAGLFYPMIIATITFVIGTLYIKERRDVKLWDEEA
jgi:MFS family permease